MDEKAASHFKSLHYQDNLKSKKYYPDFIGEETEGPEKTVSCKRLPAHAYCFIV